MLDHSRIDTTVVTVVADAAGFFLARLMSRLRSRSSSQGRGLRDGRPAVQRLARAAAKRGRCG